MEKIFHDNIFFQRIKLLLTFVFFLLLLFQTPGLLAEPLEEGAKREGKLSINSVMTTQDSQTFVSAFQKKYPFIKAEFWHGSTSAQFQRALREKQMGQNFADVLSMVGGYINLYKREGLMGKYIPLESKTIPEGFKDPEGFWTANFTAYYTFIYNIRMVAKKDIPKTYDDLLSPMWKGKIGSSNTEHEWFVGMLDLMGKEKGGQFMKRLADQGPILRAGRSLTANLMVAGEFPMALGVVARTLEMQKDGAPLEMMFFPGPTLAGMRMIGIHANAPHPNAAKLFVEFTLSQEGQRIFSNMSRHPVRMDVQVDTVVEKLRRNLFPITPKDPDVAQRYVNEYNRIFLKR